jgi:hypothetical protein
MKFRVPNSNHFNQKWRVHSLAKDFIVEDTWEFPYFFNKSEGLTLSVFQKNAVEPMMKGVFDKSLTGLLFKLRKTLGRLTNVDKDLNTLPIPGCSEISLKDRLDKSDILKNKKELEMDISTDDFMNFQPVYSFENESLHELSNLTEHALMHYSWVQTLDDRYKIQVTVYVKHRNFRGRLYMGFIKPFRRIIVYPYIFKKCMEYWEKNTKKKL